MIHREEYYTCDRCGAVIDPKEFCGIPIQRTQVFNLFTDERELKAYMSGDIKTILNNQIGMTINECYEYRPKEYHLCYKCRKDFGKFMKNETV